MTDAAAVVLSGILVIAVAVAAHARRWSDGRRVAVGLRGLLDVPRRYFRGVHAVVAREPFSAPMHVGVAGGLGVLALAALAGSWLPAAAPWLATVATLVVAAGTAANAWRRRRPLPRQHASGRVWPLSPWFVLCFVFAGAAFLAFSGGWPMALFVVASCSMTWALVVGPLRHAVAGVVHLGTHPRRGRFEGSGIDAGMRRVDLDADAPGAVARSEFPWTTLAQFDACVQCGRCEAACPAFAAGQPLNPKRLVFDLAAAGWNPPRYDGAPHPGPPEVAAGVLADEGPVASATLWACTTCRACVDACPMFIEHVDAVVDLRRAAVMRHGRLPAGAAAALEHVRACDNRFGLPPSDRTAWIGGLEVRRLAPGEATDILLWTGDAAFEPRGQATLRAMALLLQGAALDFAVLGGDEPDCGDLARRLGDEALAGRQVARVCSTLERYRFSRILTIDPHVANAFRHDVPEVGSRWPVHHHAAFLAELVAAHRLRLEATDVASAVTVHDPCYVSRYLGESDATRRLLQAMGASIREPAHHGRGSRCCGFGGGAALADVPGRIRISEQRAHELATTGAARVAVSCPNCTAMLTAGSADALPVADIAELVLESARRSTA
jgi:Fe-S oxidoreductase